MSEKNITDKIDHLEKSHGKRLARLEEKVQDIHDYITDLKGFFRGQESVRTDKRGNPNKISKEVWSLVFKLVTIITALIGVIAVITERTQ